MKNDKLINEARFLSFINIIEICMIIITICMVVGIGNTIYQQHKVKSAMNDMLEGNFGFPK